VPAAARRADSARRAELKIRTGEKKEKKRHDLLAFSGT